MSRSLKSEVCYGGSRCRWMDAGGKEGDQQRRALAVRSTHFGLVSCCVFTQQRPLSSAVLCPTLLLSTMALILLLLLHWL